MEGSIALVPSPARIFRVSRHSDDPFAPPPLDKVRRDGSHGSRLDDPGTASEPGQGRRFRTIYGASTATGAFGETLAQFRSGIALLADLGASDAVDSNEQDPESVTPVGSPNVGVVPRSWLRGRVLACTRPDPALRFVDVAHSGTHQLLRRALAPTVAALGLTDLDFSAVIGPHRLLTQRIARYLYDLRNDEGEPAAAGIRYLSRLNPEWECWAIFADRMIHTLESVETIDGQNAHVRQVCDLFHLQMAMDLK